jgi:hypothetical protein
LSKGQKAGSPCRTALAPATRREFEEALAKIPTGYSEGFFADRRYGVTLARSDDGKRSNLFARELGGQDVVSFNLFRLGSGEARLKPCEMSNEKVETFVVGLTQRGPK